MIGMSDLKASQSRFGQLADQVFWHQPAAALSQRVRERADPARGRDQADRADRVERVAADVGPAAGADPVRRERLLRPS